MVLKIKGKALDANSRVDLIEDLIKDTTSPGNQKSFNLGVKLTDKVTLFNFEDGLAFASRNNKIELNLDGIQTEWKPYLKVPGNHSLTVKLKAPHRGGVNELALTAEWSLPPNHGQRR